MAQGPAMIASGRRLPKRIGPAVTTALSCKASLMGMAYRDWPIAESPGAGTPERLAPSAQGCGFVVLVLVIPREGSAGRWSGSARPAERAKKVKEAPPSGGSEARPTRGALIPAPRPRPYRPERADSGSKRCRAALLLADAARRRHPPAERGARGHRRAGPDAPCRAEAGGGGP